MIRNSLNKLYIGISENPFQRVIYHNQKRGAEFTKYKDTFEIVFLEKYLTLSQARAREIQLKKWGRAKKDFLIERYGRGLETKL